MSIFEFLFGKKNKSANLARDRLQIIIAQERNTRDTENETPDFLPTLQKELLEVLSKYVKIELDDINIAHEKRDGIDMLELNITLPDNKTAKGVSLQ
ncbi:cell division topological specificity factor MinE [Conchiformibius kuhniae]|uniref:Cell division topological specificity factor n=1 Tax=Conchiformibius kuhniae TaxID=211502 RepID=A0A8T9MV50_9NEIS|nr:cell division topological specificity factor MinE [Conchiformibius kuhniae]UOP05557.1 cell division topological specificity factor MinE [Conchiformibius kuhniae]